MQEPGAASQDKEEEQLPGAASQDKEEEQLALEDSKPHPASCPAEVDLKNETNGVSSSDGK